jgi:hypothetical protein
MRCWWPAQAEEPRTLDKPPPSMPANKRAMSLMEDELVGTFMDAAPL